MADHALTVTALVLRRSDSGESDRRVVLLTRERGRMEVLAKGARKPGSRLVSATEPMNLVELHLATGRRLAYVTQVQPLSAFRGIRQDFDRLTYAMALCELLSQITFEDLLAPDLLELSCKALAYMEAAVDPLLPLIWGELKILELEGALPSFVRCVQTGQELKESPAWFSFEQGGYVHSSVADSVERKELVEREPLIGLGLTAELEDPPPKLRQSAECFRLLVHCLEYLTHRKLEAHRSCLEPLLLRSLKGTTEG